MKTIKIFLASSEELENDRMAFGNLVRKLDKIYERRGIRVELFEWEDYDAAYNGQRKQDEYNDHIKASDLFLALFHTKAGKFTVEEFDVATEEFRQKASPKVYVYCKDLQAGETESPELAEFKQRLFDEMGHYWCRYGNRDTMQLHFVMQLQLVENSHMDALKVDEKGAVTLDGTPVAHMDQLPFAAGNKSYQKMSAELLELPEKIEKARERVKKLPDDKDLRDDLQSKLDRYNQLKEDFTNLQQNLFNTAKVIANLQQKQVSAMLRRAIEAFEKGNLERANALLDEIAHEADYHMERLEQHKELLEQDRTLVHQDIDAFMLQAQTIMADPDIPIEESIDRAFAIYAKADEWAQRSAYDKEKYAQLLFAYGVFLDHYARYEEAENVILRQTSLSEEIFGDGHPNTVFSYNLLGLVYTHQGNYDKALDYFLKARDILEKKQDTDFLETQSLLCNNIGLIYNYKGNYPKALDFYGKALTIQEQLGQKESEVVGLICLNIGDTCRLLGDNGTAMDYAVKSYEILEKAESISVAKPCLTIANTLYSIGEYDDAIEGFNEAIELLEYTLGPSHPETAEAYSSIGLTYMAKGDFTKALEYSNKALKIRETVLGSENQFTASSYFRIGEVYARIGNFEKALDYQLKALDIRQRLLGEEHIDTAESYCFTGSVFNNLGDYKSGLHYFQKALEIQKRIFGDNHQNTAISYMGIGESHHCLGEFQKALKCHQKALEIFEKVVGVEHINTASCYYNIGLVYQTIGEYDKALQSHQKALEIFEKVVGPEHNNTASCYDSIGSIYCSLGKFDKALKSHHKALEIFEKNMGVEHLSTAGSYEHIGLVYYELDKYDKAFENFQKALEIYEKVVGIEHLLTANCYNSIGNLYYKQSNYPKALECYKKVLTINEKIVGANHPNMAGIYANVGLIYSQQGKSDLALEHYRKAQSINEKSLGKEHPNIARNYNYIGVEYFQRGDFIKAMKFLEKALAINEKVLGSEHPETITVKQNIESLKEAMEEGIQLKSTKGGFFSRLFGKKK